MIGTYKQFDKAWFDTNDKCARETVKTFFHNLGFEFTDNPNQYGIDLVSVFQPIQFFEVERRSIWTTPQWPYPTVHIPERKTKFIKIHGCHYAVVNRGLDRIGICHSTNLAKHMQDVDIMKGGNAQGEGFLNVPVDLFKWVNVPRN